MSAAPTAAPQHPSPPPAAAPAEARAAAKRLRETIASVIRGKDTVIDHVLTCLLAGGHLLVEDLPGLGKTTLAYALARSIDCSFSRVQFTSDLLPSDILGVSVYDENLRQFVFQKGPVFANVVLADEINRATPRTQSALLEVMDRGKVSADGQTLAVGQPFLVVATQNPVDYESTFPLPDSQMDRFLMRLEMGYAREEDELDILMAGRRAYDHLDIDAALGRTELLALQQAVPRVYVEDSVLRYLLAIVRATREERQFTYGVSTRGGIALKLAAQASALADGRDFVLPEDIERLAPVVLIHRLGLRQKTGDSLEERRVVEGALARLIDSVPKPA